MGALSLVVVVHFWRFGGYLLANPMPQSWLLNRAGKRGAAGRDEGNLLGL